MAVNNNMDSELKLEIANLIREQITNEIDKLQVDKLKNAVLNSIRILDSWTFTNIKKIFTSAPTHKPKNKDEQIILVHSGSDYYLYLWVDNAWKKATLS